MWFTLLGTTVDSLQYFLGSSRQYFHALICIFHKKRIFSQKKAPAATYQDQKHVFFTKKGACGNVPGPKTYFSQKKAPAAALLDQKNIFLRTGLYILHLYFSTLDKLPSFHFSMYSTNYRYIDSIRDRWSACGPNEQRGFNFGPSQGMDSRNPLRKNAHSHC